MKRFTISLSLSLGAFLFIYYCYFFNIKILNLSQMDQVVSSSANQETPNQEVGRVGLQLIPVMLHFLGGVGARW